MSFACVNGVESTQCRITDRGLQYGDGVFETLLCVERVPLNFEQHWTRLTRGCDALGIAPPDIREQVLEIAREHNQHARAVVKLIVTRGDSVRGYRCPEGVAPNWILTIGPAPGPAPSAGVDITVCRTRVPLEDERLAGLKHLNRLTQVLARNEWRDEYFDGLLRDHQGCLADGTANNVFFVKDGRLITPDLATGGVAGIMRQQVIDHAKRNSISLEIRRVQLTELQAADEIFLTNSVYGVTPVRSVAGTAIGVGPVSHSLREQVCRLNCP